MASPALSAAEVQLRAVPGSPDVDVRLEGDWHSGVTLHRCFPLSDPARFISLLGRDGKELAILDHLDELDPASRQVADAALDRRYFTPAISRIMELEKDAGMWRFKVETQRGESEFYVRNWRDSAFEIDPGRWLILSVDGGRYEIKKLETLDPLSLRLLDQLL
ncbi:MAG: hypothetical protein C4320_03805 [Armatimonadota bacterium]